MHYCCNSGMAQKISKKMSVLRDSAKDNPDLQSSIGEKLIALHPGISPDRITADVQEIYNGIRVFSDFYEENVDTKTGRLIATPEALLATQMDTLGSDIDKWDYLSSVFQSIKYSDGLTDKSVSEMEINKEDLSQLSLDEFLKVVSRQIEVSTENATRLIVEGGLDGLSSCGDISILTENDAVLLASAQYSEALDGTLNFEYTRAPRLLGLCAATQLKACEFFRSTNILEVTDGEELSISGEILLSIIILLACILLGTLMCVIADPVLLAIFDITDAVFGFCMVGDIVAMLLSFPAIWAAASTAIGILYGAGYGIYKLAEFFDRLKIQNFYKGLCKKLGVEKPEILSEGRAHQNVIQQQKQQAAFPASS